MSGDVPNLKVGVSKFILLLLIFHFFPLFPKGLQYQYYRADHNVLTRNLQKTKGKGEKSTKIREILILQP